MLVADGKLASSDLSQWRAHGMRASASGRVNFSGIEVTNDSIIGGPDDFHRQPMFSIGVWRFAAVQLGGIAALCDVARDHLVSAGRSDDPHQLARIGDRRDGSRVGAPVDFPRLRGSAKRWDFARRKRRLRQYARCSP